MKDKFDPKTFWGPFESSAAAGYEVALGLLESACVYKMLKSDKDTATLCMYLLSDPVFLDPDLLVN